MRELQTLLAKIDDLASQVSALRPLDYLTEQKVRQKLWLDWNYHSNAIEGNTLSLGETRAFLLHGITAQGKPFRDYLDIEGHRKAIEYLEEFIRQEEQLTEAYIRELHRVLLVEPYEMDALTAEGHPTKRRINVGQYKSAPNSVRTSTGAMHFYASPEETPARMGDLMAWYREITSKGEIHPVILAASFHFRFVEIHPFDDGNGRMSRLLMNLMLMRNGLVPIIVPTERKPEYILALEQADAGDIEPFVGFIGEQVINSLELYLKAARGESIDNLSDIDKRVAILDKQLKNEQAKQPQKRSYQTQHLLHRDTVTPLFTNLRNQLIKLGHFFMNSSLYFGFRGDTTVRRLSQDISLEEFLSQLNQQVGSQILKEITFSYQLQGLKTDPSVDLKTVISFLLEDFDFMIESNTTSISKDIKQSAIYQYGQSPTDDLIEGIVYDISSTLLTTIEQKMKES